MTERRAWTGALVAAAVILAVFGPMALRCGLYADDFSLILLLKDASWPELWTRTLHYVPGRNLQIPVYAALLKLAGGSTFKLHLLTLLFGALNAALAYLLFLELFSLASLALPAALAFALMTHHGETRFWFTQSLQCELPLALVLSAFLIALRPSPSPSRRLAASMSLYTAALFTYDQVFFLWPLLVAAAWARSNGNGWRAVRNASLYGLGVNIVYILGRHLAPHSDGGRPVIRLSGLLHRPFESVYAALKGAFATPSRPEIDHWAWAALAAAGTLAGTWLLLRLQKRWLADEEESLAASLRTPKLLRLALFGAAWFFLAYLPNYFWYISPRHNYLPSFGWALFWVSALAWLWGRRPGLGPAMGAASALLLANAVLGNLAEGSQWVRAARLHDAYLEEARRFFPDFDNIFLVGAPRRLRRAPAFDLHHDSVLSAALDSGRGGTPEGDNHITPTRRGAFYYNDLTLWDESSWRWMAYGDMNLIAYDKVQGFKCVKGMRLTGPDGRQSTAATSRKASCSKELHLEMQVALLAAETAPAAKESRPVPGIPGLGLSRAGLVSNPEGLRLTLEWSVGEPIGSDLALVPEILALDGQPLYKPVYPSPTAGPKTPVIWPLINDERPASRWAAGTAVRETYLLRFNGPLESGPCRLRLTLYRLSPRDRPERAATLELDAVLIKG